MCRYVSPSAKPYPSTAGTRKPARPNSRGHDTPTPGRSEYGKVTVWTLALFISHLWVFRHPARPFGITVADGTERTVGAFCPASGRNCPPCRFAPRRERRRKIVRPRCKGVLSAEGASSRVYGHQHRLVGLANDCSGARRLQQQLRLWRHFNEQHEESASCAVAGRGRADDGGVLH